MTAVVNLAYDGQIICEPIGVTMQRLTDIGFVLLNNGDDSSTLFFDVGPKSLHFKFFGPIPLSEVESNYATYYLAPLSKDMFMCECHYHIIKLVDFQ